jgi:hypothetical protein
LTTNPNGRQAGPNGHYRTPSIRPDRIFGNNKTILRLIALSKERRSGGDQDRPGVLVHATGLREQKQAKRYKQFLVTLSVIFPLTIFVPWVLQPLFQTMPFLG